MVLLGNIGVLLVNIGVLLGVLLGSSWGTLGLVTAIKNKEAEGGFLNTERNEERKWCDGGVGVGRGWGVRSDMRGGYTPPCSPPCTDLLASLEVP